MSNVDLNAQAPQKRMKLWLKILIIIIVIAGVFWQLAPAIGWLFGGPSIDDRMTVWNYKPDSDVVAIVQKSGLNDNGRFYFYTGQPQLDDSENFNIDCADVMHAETVVLGCYDGRIFIFNVTDDRISGVKYVTAVHEMLHAAYERLGVFDRANVDAMLNRQLDQTTDETILDLVATYDRTEPGERLNELHSIFATEVRDLSPELEQYYDRYFRDRTVVVAENEKYMDVFKQMELRADELETKLTALDEQINAREQSYDGRANRLSGEIDRFNSCADIIGCFASESSFNTQRARLIAEQNSLMAEFDAINQLIDEYNGYVSELQALGREVEKLQNNLDSRTLDL